MTNNNPRSGMPSDMRKIARAGMKEGWEWQLNKSGHFEVFTPKGRKVTTVAPRNRHWKVRFESVTSPFNYPVK